MSVSGTVYVVDDDLPFLVAIGRWLRAVGFQVLAFQSGLELLARVSGESRGCIVADLHMPAPNGLELQETLADLGVALPIVFLTAYGDVRSAVYAIKRGAVDFLDKCGPKDALLQAVHHAMEQDVIGRTTRARREDLRSRFAALTRREGEVLSQVVRGKMNKQIAAELHIHERTVKLHRMSITNKLGVRSVAEITALAHEAQLLQR
jgi:FixJ family two-component response regulator